MAHPQTKEHDMAALTLTDLPPAITLVAWDDPLVEAHCFGPRSGYAETVWLPILGPTASWLYRKLAVLVELGLDGIEIDLADLAVSLGLGERTGRNSMLSRAIARCVQFQVARWQPDGCFAVRRALAPVTERRATRLPASVRRFHEQHTRLRLASE
jgi:hypothetical protein